MVSEEQASAQIPADSLQADLPEEAPPLVEPSSSDSSIDPVLQPGDVIVTARDRGYAPDPARALNAESFAATQAVDTAFVRPVALAYKKTVPSPIRDGIHNFLYNLREPVVFVNFILQLKIGKAAETAGRFAINSTVGVVGVVDVAKRRPFKLPRRGNGFADTLGFYGVPPGPFMFLPIVGPTTVRDLFGGVVDRLVLPATFGSRITKPEFVIPSAVLGALDHRAEFDDTLKALHDGAADPYANSRDFYLQRRQAEIDQLRGRTVRNTSPMSERPQGPILLRGRAPVTPPADVRP
jgi:phospholipid-binding lipoprotein MlaA